MMGNLIGNLAIGIIIGAAIVLAILLATGVTMDEIFQGDRADLRLISQPYLEASGLKDICLASGAAWHEEPDFVGCVGLGPNFCTSDIVLAGQTQCLATGANWYCETGTQGFIYCAYE